MKDICVLVDDDTALVKAWAPILDLEVMERFNWQLDVHVKISSLEDRINSRRDMVVRAAIVDLWMVDKDNGRSDSRAGFRAIDLIRGKWADCFIVVFSGHLTKETLVELGKYRNISVIPKTKPESIVTRELGRAMEVGAV